VLYIDIDIHHGDGVQVAESFFFYLTFFHNVKYSANCGLNTKFLIIGKLDLTTFYNTCTFTVYLFYQCTKCVLNDAGVITGSILLD